MYLNKYQPRNLFLILNFFLVIDNKLLLNDYVDLIINTFDWILCQINNLLMNSRYLNQSEYDDNQQLFLNIDSKVLLD
jgi:hypothetical protein